MPSSISETTGTCPACQATTRESDLLKLDELLEISRLAMMDLLSSPRELEPGAVLSYVVTTNSVLKDMLRIIQNLRVQLGTTVSTT